MQVKEITLYEEKQRLDEVWNWVLVVAAYLWQGAMFAGVSYITMEGMTFMVDKWRKANFNPIAEAIPNKMRMKLHLQKGDAGYGRTGVKPKWFQYNAYSGKWHEVRPPTSVSPWRLVKGGRVLVGNGLYLQRALWAQSKLSGWKRMLGINTFINLKGISKEAWQAAYIMAKAGMQNAGGKYAAGDVIPGKPGVLGDDGKDGTERRAKVGDPDVRDARSKYPDSLEKYKNYINQSKKAAAWAAASKYIAKIGPWLMMLAPLGSALGMVYWGRATALAYYAEFEEWEKWRDADKETRGPKVGITLEEYTERMIAYRASIFAVFVGGTAGLGILGATMIVSNIIGKGLGMAIDKFTSKADLDSALEKDFKKLGRAAGRNIPITRVIIWVGAIGLIPLSMTRTGQRAFAYLLTEFTFFGMFEDTYWDNPNGGLRSTIATWTDGAFKFMLEKWIGVNAYDWFGKNAILNPEDQSAYQAGLKNTELQNDLNKGKVLPVDELGTFFKDKAGD